MEKDKYYLYRNVRDVVKSCVNMNMIIEYQSLYSPLLDAALLFLILNCMQYKPSQNVKLRSQVLSCHWPLLILPKKLIFRYEKGRSKPCDSLHLVNLSMQKLLGFVFRAASISWNSTNKNVLKIVVLNYSDKITF